VVPLRRELAPGRWTGLMPGRDRLVDELGVNGRMVERALSQLEKQGRLQSQGVGKRRRVLAGQPKAEAARNVALLAADEHPTFQWFTPPVAHIRWERGPVLRRVVRWVNNVSRGREDRRKSLTKAKLVASDVPALQP